MKNTNNKYKNIKIFVESIENILNFCYHYIAGGDNL